MAFVETGRIWAPQAGQSQMRPLRRRGGWHRFKRPFDLALVILSLPVVLPVVLLVLGVVALDGATPLYRQQRVGRSGRPFWCYKIRSMVPDAEAALERLCAADASLAAEWRENQKLVHDPRITRIGRLLRRTSLDELPQLWNVLCGEMSLVGPRPYTPDQRAAYVAAGGLAYFAVRPGLTGPWQVSGRGRSRFAERVAYDNAYVAHMGLVADICLIWRTLGVVLRCTGH